MNLEPENQTPEIEPEQELDDAALEAAAGGLGSSNSTDAWYSHTLIPFDSSF